MGFLPLPFHEKPRSVWRYIIVFLFVFIAIGFFFLWRAYVDIRHDPGVFVGKVFSESRVLDLIQKEFPKREADTFALLPELLGFTTPQTYLFLFLNNTELRPGGGFIGSYATVRADKGTISVRALEGSEMLDADAPKTWIIPPPDPMKTYLGVDRWYFRDSNWSPDFAVDARRALDFYTAEGGVDAADIDTVVAITPTVLEEVLRRTGPVTVEGITFDADTVTEKLQYEVEYAYADRGKTLAERKNILDPFFRTLFPRLLSYIIRDPKAGIALVETLASEKQVMAYATKEPLISIIQNYDLAGQTKQVTHDYMRYVDANLAALKTDRAMRRALAYTVKTNGTKTVAKTTMTYRHLGSFDWRTTRYLSYARVFVPEGAVLQSARITAQGGMTMPLPDMSSGTEDGYTWFGGYVSVEPGQTKAVTFEYELPDRIRTQVAEGSYALLVQKQLGAAAYGLTLNIDFARVVTSALPAETADHWGDSSYSYTAPLAKDLSVRVGY